MLKIGSYVGGYYLEYFPVPRVEEYFLHCRVSINTSQILNNTTIQQYFPGFRVPCMLHVDMLSQTLWGYDITSVPQAQPNNHPTDQRIPSILGIKSLGRQTFTIPTLVRLGCPWFWSGFDEDC